MDIFQVILTTITTSSWADGFEITCEENTGNTKTGTFFNTNSSATSVSKQW